LSSHGGAKTSVCRGYSNKNVEGASILIVGAALYSAARAAIGRAENHAPVGDAVCTVIAAGSVNEIEEETFP